MKSHAHELLRYIINGVVATAVHYGVLTANLNIFAFESAGLANFVAALCGISMSFLGSRYFVFKNTAESFFMQFSKFGGLYGLIAIAHGAVLFVWTDLCALDYRIGFLIATALQMSCSYLGNKFWVFE